MKRVAEISEDRRDQGIRWLVMERDPNSQGFFVYLHRDLHEPCEYDHWYESQDEAIRQMNLAWGIIESDWRDWP